MKLQVTDKALYLNRRQFIGAAIGLAATARLDAQPAVHGRRLENVQKSPLSTGEPPNPWEHITSYNNYYEFGIDKHLRLVVPWKYGFKSIKAIVKIRFTEKEPLNTWQEAAPSLYGFYSNVNPAVGYQGSERRLGEFLKRKTVIFNGYGDQVGSMYAGMNLRRYF